MGKKPEEFFSLFFRMSFFSSSRRVFAASWPGRRENRQKGGIGEGTKRSKEEIREKPEMAS
jgi:hypothetical protein